MVNAEILVALENIIFQFAQGQFEANGVTPLEARLVMEAVDGKFQKLSLETLLMSMVKPADNGETEQTEIPLGNEKFTEQK